MDSINTTSLSEHQLSTLRRLKRYLLSESDLSEAYDYATALRDMDEGESWRSRQTRLALTTAFVVAYARPFSKNNRGSKGEVGRSLGKAVLSNLTSDERRLHDEIIAARDSLYAHSDADLFELGMTVKPTGHISSGHVMPRKPLSGQDLELAVSLTVKLEVFLKLSLIDPDHGLPVGRYGP